MQSVTCSLHFKTDNELHFVFQLVKQKKNKAKTSDYEMTTWNIFHRLHKKQNTHKKFTLRVSWLVRHHLQRINLLTLSQTAFHWLIQPPT